MENKKIKDFHWKILLYCIILFVLLFLGSLSTEFDISTGNLIEKLYELMMIISALLTFEIVFYMFTFRVVIENKRASGLRERIFKEKMEDVLGKKINLKELTKEKWEKLVEEFKKAKKGGEEKFYELFNEANRRDLLTLRDRYKKNKKIAPKNWRRLECSLIPALSAIFFSFLIIIFENLDLEIPSFVINLILAFIIISFVIFLIATVYYIPFVVEDWITEKKDSEKPR